MQVDPRDEFCYLGTMTGDICKVCINCCETVNVTKMSTIAALQGAYGIHNPRKPYGKDCNKYVNGVRAVHIIDKGLLLIGAGDGTLELVQERKDMKDIMFKDYPNPTWPMLESVRCSKLI